MGLSPDSTRFLAQAWKAGVRCDETLTLGRQHMLVSPQRMESILQACGAWPPPQGAAEFHRLLAESSWRFDTFARALGANNVSSMDASPYEGASLVHDLNQPIPPDWEEKFDLIVDGGTLEHVFNFPVAIANCMRMVKTGGHVILFTPANNYFGHGFYQFSPELFYRVFARENGFEIREMIALADYVGVGSVFGVKYPFPITGPWYAARDPADIRQRVTLINDRAVILMVLAKKISRQNIFANTPQQSDFVSQWQTGALSNPLGQTEKGAGLANYLRKKLPESFLREIMPRLAFLLDPFREWRFRRKNSFSNPELYKRVKTD
jgi:SAM-dependent methyltransferase